MSPRISLAHISTYKRLIHTSRPSFNFIGHPDPTSNIRPIIYTTSSLSSLPESKHHPYSLREFSDDTLDHELQWKLHREQLDAFNHAYWAEASPALSSGLSKNEARQDEYAVELRKRTFEDLSLSAKVEFQRAKKRLASWRLL
ncbi:uncharacterized protein EDB91DRAFT_1241761 [Suillus paluster]|uniref:uncharacterized protein n=1 Tax=Suillus paluster TaxID=48578 RepID=UPI001B870C04|nr:uncharacterized protein EDB91DRAFT_1241761 [Suillus paluster]KAG1756708.1 hypothetical protein EDB91DRAFT_1241761 [Suillus paluster]